VNSLKSLVVRDQKHASHGSKGSKLNQLSLQEAATMKDIYVTSDRSNSALRNQSRHLIT